MKIPTRLDWWRAVPGGVKWLESLPSIVEACAERWSLRIDEAFDDSNVSLVAVERDDGTPTVLKVNFPEQETEREPDALSHWGGKGAVRLIAYDEALRALLIERCMPGVTALDDRR